MSDDESILIETAQQIGCELVYLASQLKPFPAFLEMATIQAIELEPIDGMEQDHGCVVVTPDGEIRRFDLAVIPGVPGLSDVEHVDQFVELDLSLAEYIAYARLGINALTEELRRRG